MIGYTYTNDPTKKATLSVAENIKKHLINGEHVLWLLSGGSGIPIAIEASRQLKSLDLAKLSVSLTDERYGEIGHKDENWQQLLDSGFNLPKANLYRPLIGKDIEETTMAFNNWLMEQFNIADYKIGIFGLGTDGHTAGIKPHSNATTSTDFASYFIGNDFKRITISFIAIQQLDKAIIQASGDDKKLTIHNLITSNMPLDDQPSQIFKTMPRVTLYTNNKGEYK